MARIDEVKAYLESQKYAGSSPTEIAKALGLNDSSHVSASLKKLVADGWAYRDEDRLGVFYGMNQHQY